MSNDTPNCPWCGKPVLAYEMSTEVDGKPMHIDCATAEEDDVFFDRDMGFGDN